MAVSISIAITQNSQSIANNSSNVTVKVNYSWTNGSFNRNSTTKYVKINGTQYNFNDVDINGGNATSGSGTLYTKTLDIKHNTDGTGKVEAYAYVNTNISSGVLTKSASKTLTTIPRAATLTNSPNFNDEGNPKINYSNPAGSAVTSLQACISDANGSTIYIPYRDISKSGTSYTFNLTDAERNTLRNACKNAKSMTVKFYIKTVLGGNTYYSSSNAKTLTITNAAPTVTATAKDVGTVTTPLTGDANKMIKGYNYISVNMSATALKGATIKSYKITNGSSVINAASGSFTNSTNKSFVFTATDSRGYSTSKTINLTLIDYIKLTCSYKAHATVDGVATLNISGNYFNGSFGAVANTLTVQYRYKESGGSYSAWTNATATKSGNTYSADVNISGLDYQKTYVVQARATDKITTVTPAEKTVKALPVFDWGDNDFNFNVPVTFTNGYIAHNVLLWQGAYFMTANQTCNLTQPITSQPHGIVLVFSNYDTANSKANDYDWHCYFVPKYLVDIKDGTGHCFNMMSQAFGDIASKYIYISDTSLTGNDVNTTTGTKNGITYHNAKYVLRYIFGV